MMRLLGRVMSATEYFAYVDEIAPDKADADHAALVAYLLSAVRRSDWHAVSDAANDLRVLEARGR